jgi:hypothetical protein
LTTSCTGCPPTSIWRASLTSSPSDPWAIIGEYVELQRNFLRNPLPSYPWICPTCRGVRTEGYPLCIRCQSHYDRSGGILSDLVVPISYSPRTGQHHHNLRTYKGSAPSLQARWNLLALLLLFLRHHMQCIAAAAGATPTHMITVPSTGGRSGPHPLPALIGTRLGLPALTASANPRFGAEDRDFHSDWFTVGVPTDAGPAHVLLLDDTWTTGARAQSLAHALKTTGAATVATVVLGRHVNPEHRLSRPLLSAIADPIFDISRCAAETSRLLEERP